MLLSCASESGLLRHRIVGIPPNRSSASSARLTGW